MIGRLAECPLPNVDEVDPNPDTIVARMLPLVRLHAFEARLKRMLGSLETGGRLDAETGLLTRDCFFRELGKAVAEAGDRSQPLSLARLFVRRAAGRTRRSRPARAWSLA